MAKDGEVLLHKYSTWIYIYNIYAGSCGSYQIKYISYIMVIISINILEFFNVVIMELG